VRASVVALCLTGQAASAECLPLGDLGYVLELDRPAIAVDESGVTISSAAQTRTPSTIRLFPMAEASFPKHTELANGIGLSYTTDVKPADVSGGFEARLSGWFQGAPSLGVQCSTAGKDPDPEWCLPILGQIRPAQAGCDTGNE
jgi:hypothetical protein